MGPRADRENLLSPPEFEPRNVHPVAQSLYRLLSAVLNQGKWDCRSTWNAPESRDMSTVFGWAYLKARNHFEDPGVGWGDTKMEFKEMWLDGEDCIHLTQNRDQWRAVVNTVQIWFRTMAHYYAPRSLQPDTHGRTRYAARAGHNIVIHQQITWSFKTI